MMMFSCSTIRGLVMAAALLANVNVSSATQYVRGNRRELILPPGYEDEMWCPPGYCARYKNQGEGFVGPQRSFWECYNPEHGIKVDGIWTGSLTNVTPPNDWIMLSSGWEWPNITCSDFVDNFPGITGLFNTGVDYLGKTLGDRETDTHYGLKCAQCFMPPCECRGCPGGRSFQCPANPVTVPDDGRNVPTSWEQNRADARWISPYSVANGPEETTMVYSIGFQVEGCDVWNIKEIEISGEFAADQCVDEILLNADFCLYHPSSPPKDYIMHEFTITIAPNQLRSNGQNELRFLVSNKSFQTGFFLHFISATVTCTCPVGSENCLVDGVPDCCRV